MDDNDRIDFIKRLETKLKRIDREVRRWQIQTEQSRPEQRLQVMSLRQQIANLQAALLVLRANSGTAWDLEKNRLRRDWNEIKASYNSAMRNF